MTGRRQCNQRDSGAALILAIGFVLAIGALSGGLAGLASSGLNNRRDLETTRDREYDADGAIESAIAQVRGQPVTTCGAADPPPIGFAPPVAPSVMRVDWFTVCTSLQPSGYAQRNVIFSACANTGSVCDPASVIIRAQVNFEPATGPATTKTFVQSWNVNR